MHVSVCSLERFMVTYTVQSNIFFFGTLDRNIKNYRGWNFLLGFEQHKLTFYSKAFNLGPIYKV